MMRLVLLLAAIAFTTFSYGQKKPKAVKPDLKKFPQVSYDGRLVHSVTWTDKAGTHLFVASETGVRETSDSTGNKGKTAQIIAQHFMIGDTIKRTWTEGDSIVFCPVMAEITFLPLFYLTDLDKDGYNELWIMYRSLCHGELSPANMQLVMREESQRFTMIGTSKIQTADKQFFGGEYKFNNQFLEGNPVFKKRGMDIWNDHMKGY